MYCQKRIPALESSTSTHEQIGTPPHIDGPRDYSDVHDTNIFYNTVLGTSIAVLTVLLCIAMITLVASLRFSNEYWQKWDGRLNG